MQYTLCSVTSTLKKALIFVHLTISAVHQLQFKAFKVCKAKWLQNAWHSISGNMKKCAQPKGSSGVHL